ncbi:hypothetical protein RND71_009841 [Anisodus tanguticus]|uniref:Phosphatidylinositol transfer protein N-terminal domain-containing protein n=1 Tax=Anisodus tanguticus TaxID=243964 RepID=A0AAE1SIK9_9SOLA|nr:hypothetical protein RND71_009841 [Anisodus tanguticus]
MQQQRTTGNERVEVLQNRPFNDAEFGEGQYTSKIYRLQRSLYLVYPGVYHCILIKAGRIAEKKGKPDMNWFWHHKKRERICTLVNLDKRQTCQT